MHRAAQYGARQVQFTPTFYWWDTGPADPPPDFDPSCKGSDLGSYYCYDRSGPGAVPCAAQY